MNWTKNDIKKVKLPHNFTENTRLSDEKKVKLPHNFTENTRLSDENKVKLPQPEKISIEKETIKKVLWVFRREKTIPDYVEEFQFCLNRKFRFDWAIPELKIAIEFEGLMSKKSRHTTITGYTNDCTKYNIAQTMGWKVLRYTVINYKELSNDLNQILCKKNGEK